MRRTSKFAGKSLIFTLLMLLCTVSAAFAGPDARNGAESAESAGERPVFDLSFTEWTDVHLGEPNTKIEVWDSIFNSSIENKDTEFFVFCGDGADNKNADELEFQKRADAFAAYLGRAAKTGRPVLVTYGNNDFYKNYNTDPENMAPVFKSWSKAMGDAYYLDDLGNGVYPELIKDTTWITVNSLIFSPRNSCDPEILKEQRSRTLEWLNDVLTVIPADSTAVLVCHVPPCVDAYNDQGMWDSESLRAFQRILTHTPGHVMILSGHTHRNEIHALPSGSEKAAPVFIAGSVSGKYGYHSNFREYQWTFDEETGEPVRCAWSVFYAEHPEDSYAEGIKYPARPGVWVAFSQKVLAENDEEYERYMRNFYCCCENWKEQAYDKGRRQAVCKEVIVDEFIDDVLNSLPAAPRNDGGFNDSELDGLPGSGKAKAEKPAA